MKTASRWQQRIFFVCAALLLAINWGLEVPLSVQVFGLVALVVLAGLPHGALDPLVARRSGLWRTPSGLVRFLALYLVFAALTLGLWMISPALGLGLFLLYSAWHFSGDWNDSLPRSLRLAAGMTVIAGPALLWSSEVAAYFAMLSDERTALLFAGTLQKVALVSFPGLAFAALKTWPTHRAVSIELLVLGLCALFLPPLLFFIIYFCTLHSPRHLLEAVQGIPARTATGGALLFTALSVIAGILAYFLLDPASLNAGLVQITFTGLAVLTVPHMILIDHAENGSGWRLRLDAGPSRAEG